MRAVEDQAVPAPHRLPPWPRGSEDAGVGERVDGWDNPAPCDLDRGKKHWRA